MVRHLVVDTGGGLAGCQVLISPRALRDIDRVGKRLTAALTKAQMAQSPAIDRNRPVSRRYKNAYDDSGYPLYWTGPYLWGDSSYPLPPAHRATRRATERLWDWAGAREDSHLRSAAAVIGHVADFLVDEATWAMRYMVVDTGTWWAGKTVRVSPEWIARIDWNAAKVSVSLTRAQIQHSSACDPAGLVQRDYKTRQFDHYNRPRSWSSQ